jgi:hypothetical protein
VFGRGWAHIPRLVSASLENRVEST